MSRTYQDLEMPTPSQYIMVGVHRQFDRRATLVCDPHYHRAGARMETQPGDMLVLVRRRDLDAQLASLGTPQPRVVSTSTIPCPGCSEEEGVTNCPACNNKGFLVVPEYEPVCVKCRMPESILSAKVAEDGLCPGCRLEGQQEARQSEEVTVTNSPANAERQRAE